jgi:glycosyltransferase involved in cell wall biosynthesis
VTFDLIVATVGRADELRALLASLEAQTFKDFRVIVVDQNADHRVSAVLADWPSLAMTHLRSDDGLSLARNAALPSVSAHLVAFPDDDCVYPADVLAHVAHRFATDPALDGIAGRDDAASWPPDEARLTRDNLWNRAISFTIFLRSELVARVGQFDEALGLPRSSAEEIDYLIRAVDTGARIEYDPSIVIPHRPRERPLTELGARDGGSIGYLLRKHRYPPRIVAGMLLRPAGGVALAMLHKDYTRARFHLSTLRGRVSGYYGAERKR